MAENRVYLAAVAALSVKVGNGDCAIVVQNQLLGDRDIRVARNL